MNIKSNILKKFNIYHQLLCSKKQILILDAYKRIRKKEQKNELEKSINKLQFLDFDV